MTELNLRIRYPKEAAASHRGTALLANPVVSIFLLSKVGVETISPYRARAKLVKAFPDAVCNLDRDDEYEPIGITIEFTIPPRGEQWDQLLAMISQMRNGTI